MKSLRKHFPNSCLFLAGFIALLIWAAPVWAIHYQITQLTNTGAYNINNNLLPKINASGEIAFVRDIEPGAVSDLEIFVYSEGVITQVSHNFFSYSTSRPYDNFGFNDNGELFWVADDETLWFYSEGASEQVTTHRARYPDFNNSGQVVFMYNYCLMQYYNGATSTLVDRTGVWIADWAASINDAGVIIYQGWDSATGLREMFLLNNLVRTRLTYDYYNDDDPIIGNGGQAVWINRSRPNQLFYYDSGTVKKITNSSNDEIGLGNQDINDHGDVVWSAQGDIWHYAYADGVTTQITTDATRGYACRFPRINNQGVIVWMVIETSGGDSLYVYYKGVTTKLDGNGGVSPDFYPDINSSG